MSGSAGSAYSAEIDALQAYQKQILTTLDGLTAGMAALKVSEIMTSAFSGTGANNGLGTFPEAVQLSNTYDSVMQTMMTNFQEITDLVTAMANALGKSAQSYLETEQQITDSFNQIVQKYESKAGSFSTSATAPAASYGQQGTSGSYLTATQGSSTTSGTGTTGTTTQSYTTTTTSSSSNSSSSSGSSSGSSSTSGSTNDANADNDTSSEE